MSAAMANWTPMSVEKVALDPRRPGTAPTVVVVAVVVEDGRYWTVGDTACLVASFVAVASMCVATGLPMIETVALSVPWYIALAHAKDRLQALTRDGH